MSVICHFKDGTTFTSSAVAAIPYPGNNEFIQLVDGSTPPVVHALVPVENLDVAEIA